MRSSLLRVCVLYAGIALLLAYVLMGIRLLRADDAVVGDGTAASCTEAAFDAALTTAHNGSGGTITFNCGGAATIIFTSAKVTNANIIIDGADQITLSGGDSTPLFTNQANLTLQHITLTDGFNSLDGGAIANTGNLTMTQAAILSSTTSLSGGGIKNTAGTAVLTDVTVSGNSANYLGGGIMNDGGTAELTDVTVSDNSASGPGGGIFNSGGSTAELTDVTVSGNSASGPGGGIFNSGGSTATLVNVTLSGNSADYGGGIDNSGSTATLVNVTLSGNLADNGGGGIHNTVSAAELTNVTLSGNSASFGGGILNSAGTAVLTNVTLSGNSASGNGGGIENLNDPDSHLILKNSIVAGSPTGGNCGGKAADEMFFSLWDDTSCTFTAGSGNLPNTDARLGPLADNGGATLTHMLLAGSPAKNAGTADGAPAIDQRGLPRPVGATPDMGAVEVQPGEGLAFLYLPVVVKP